MQERHPKRSCEGTTKTGEECHAAPLADSAYCLAHSDEEVREKDGFGGSQPGAGRPPLPIPHVVLREKVEAEIEGWLAPYERARNAKRPVTVGKGPGSHVEWVDDHKTQLRAADAVLDRVYGKARAAVEVCQPRDPILELVAGGSRSIPPRCRRRPAAQSLNRRARRQGRVTSHSRRALSPGLQACLRCQGDPPGHSPHLEARRPQAAAR